MDLAGKVAHVTGAGAGIGRAIALRLAREGAAVAVSDIDDLGGAETVSRIESSGGTALFIRADVAVEDEISGALARTEEVLGALDILVNNAGGAPEPHFPDAEPEHWLRQVRVNLFGVMLGTHYAIAAMKRSGGGAVVNISSRAGEGFRPYVAPEYAVAKAGVWRFSAALGSLAETHRIRVNCICPDWVEVESMRAERQAMGEEAWTQVAPATLVQPEEIAEVVLLLVRDESLAGRVILCPHDGPWGVVPLDETFDVDPLRGFPR
jgi:NAD(P)-dependent dehydrogenase (short-subunit alcohol dehydrogenase family)